MLIEGDDLVDPGIGDGSRYTLDNAFYMMTTEVTQGMYEAMMLEDSELVDWTEGQSDFYGVGDLH